MADNFFTEEIIEFPFRDAESRYGERTIGIEVKSRGAVNTLPEVDPGTLEIVDPQNYLRPFNAHREGEVLVFEAAVHPDLLTKPNFHELVRDPIQFTVKVREKTAAVGRTEQRWFRGTFKGQIEVPLRIWWESWPEDDRVDITRSVENRPIELEPDAKSAFILQVWAEEWNAARSRWEERPNTYDFSHWLAPNDPFIGLDVVSPEPLPGDPSLRGSSQERTTWRSKMVLPNPGRPGLREFPLDTVIRVRAWKKGDIQARISIPPYLRWKVGARHLAEVEIPLRLGRGAELVAKFDPDGDRQYRGLTLAKNGLVADGSDQLQFVVYARRKRRDPEEILELESATVELVGPGSDGYRVEQTPDPAGPGRWRGAITAKQGVLEETDRPPDTFTLRVKGTLKGSSDPEMQVDVPVLADRPRLTVRRTPNPAEMDGSMDKFVSIKPKVIVFDKELNTALLIKDVQCSDLYFRTVADPPPGEVRLRCKFRLNDPVMQQLTASGRGAEVSFKVKLGQEGDGAHASGGLSGERDVKIEIGLRPSRIACKPPDPVRLPRPGEDPSRWKSCLEAKIVTDSGTSIPGDDIRRDSAPNGESGNGVGSCELFQWGFRFSYQRSPEEWQRYNDDRGGSATIRIFSVDTDGNVTFKPSPQSENAYCDYDHWGEFYDTSKRQLGGEGCTVQAVFFANTLEYPAGPIAIGADEKTYSARVRVVAESGERIPHATVTVQDRDGMSVSAETEASGEAVVTGIRIDRGPYLVSAYKHANLDHGMTGARAENKLEGVNLTRDSQELEITLPCTTQWELASNFSAGFKFGASYQHWQFYLRKRGRRLTQRQVNLLFEGAGAVAGVSLTAAGTFEGIAPAVPFETRRPVMFEDFSGVGAIETGLSFDLLIIGYSWAYAYFHAVPHRERRIDISSWQMGGLGISLYGWAGGTWSIVR